MTTTTTTTTSTDRPLYLAWREAEKASALALAARDRARAALHAALERLAQHEHDGRSPYDDDVVACRDACDVAADAATDAESAAAEADAAATRAWEAWCNSDETRDYTVSDGNSEWTIASRPSTVCETVKATDVSDYDPTLSTWWLHLDVRCDEAAEYYDVTVTVEPKEPPCVNGRDHDWRSPHRIVGGLKENPGVRGHGGGVVSTEVCGACGCERLTDTWAQDPLTGEQGLTSVTYTPNQHAEAYRDLGREDVRTGVIDIDGEVNLSGHAALYVEGALEAIRERSDVADAVVDNHGVVIVAWEQD